MGGLGRGYLTLTKPTGIALAAAFFVHDDGFAALGTQVADLHPASYYESKIFCFKTHSYLLGTISYGPLRKVIDQAY